MLIINNCKWLISVPIDSSFSALRIQFLKEDTYVPLRSSCLHLFQSSASYFSSLYLLQFLKSSKTVFFFFLLLSFPLSVLQWHHDGGNFFSEYDRSDWLFNVGYYLEVSSSLLYVQEFFISYFLWPFYLLHSLPDKSGRRATPQVTEVIVWNRTLK